MTAYHLEYFGGVDQRIAEVFTNDGSNVKVTFVPSQTVVLGK